MNVLIFSLLFISCDGSETPKKAEEFRVNGKLTIDAIERTYTINLPPNYYKETQFSLVIALHGGGGSGDQFEKSTFLTDKANKEGFIVVYPDGVQSNGILKARTWNAGDCCDYAVEKKIDDVKFISNLIDELIKNFKINSKKVYATGHSNGGMMSYRLACELSNKIAAIAPNGSTNVSQNCAPTRLVPVLHMHSINDKKVPYLGGPGEGVGTSQLNLPPVEKTLSEWAAISNCTNRSTVEANDEKFILKTWKGCNNNFEIKFYLTKDGGHGWPGGEPGGLFSDTPSKAINANDLLWDFFQKHSIP